MVATDSEELSSLATFQNSEGVELRGILLRITRHLVVLELCTPNSVLRSSEVLSEFKIISNDETLYSGRAVVGNLVNTGLVTICEASLEDSWVNVEVSSSGVTALKLRSEFDAFVEEWQKLYRVAPDFKAIVADFQTFLMDLRLWLEQVELGIRSSPLMDHADLERRAVDELSGPVVNVIDGFIGRFETVVSSLESALQPIHRVYLRRQLHPLVLCSPFAYRTFTKPLGYAGDYEVVNMMMRPPYEGSTLFAKVVNVWLLGQSPVVAHRNRVTYLTGKLVEETARKTAHTRPARVLSVGCGPAWEVQQFMQEQPNSNHVDFDLLDFNEETLRDLRTKLESIQRRCNRSTRLHFVKKSVYHLLKEGGRSADHGFANRHDLIYCAGLFDYLSNQVCKRLMNVFYGLLAPGGLLVATNVSDAMNASRPFRYSMEYILDWQLIYRDGRQVRALAPEEAPPDNVTVLSEHTGVNILIEVRKPNHA